MQIPFQSFEFQNRQVRNLVLQAMTNVFDAEWYILGSYLKKFEQEYATFSQTQHCIGVGNGLDALHIALKVLGIGPGDEVLVPAHTFIATWLAVSLTGAKPVPVDADPQTYNINPQLLEREINSRTRAIIPVHLYGQPCEMDSIMALARHYQLWVVEDNAQAQGATYNGQLTGSFGHLNATSFYPSKNLGALGDGGALTTNHPDLAHHAYSLRNYGSSQKFYHETIGLNSRLDELQAAVLSQKLPFLPSWNQERMAIANNYINQLQNIPAIQMPFTAPNTIPVYHQFVISTPYRNALQKYLAEKGVSTFIHYPIPPYRQAAYRHLSLQANNFPVANNIAATGLSLPIWPGLDEESINYICKQIEHFFRQKRTS